MDRSIQEAAESVAVEKVYISVDRFPAWCADANVRPNNLSRARYATIVGFPRSET